MKKTGKTFVFIILGILFVLVLLCAAMTIPAVQTFAGKQVTAFLSKKMNAELSVEKLRINWDLTIVAHGIYIGDQHGNNLISASYARMDFPIFKSRYLEFNHVYADSADVCFRTYLGEDEFNLRFFIDFFSNDEEPTEKMVVNFNYLQLKNSRFQLRNDNTAMEDEENLWNYRNMILTDINTNMKQMLIIGDSLNFYIDQLQAKERSGFSLTDFHGHLQISQTGLYCFDTKFQTGNGSLLDVDFGFDFKNGYQSFKNFFKEVAFNTYLHPSQFNTKDLTYFVKAFEGLEDTVSVQSSVHGVLSDINFDSTLIRLSPQTWISAHVNLLGLPTVEEMFIDANIEDFNANIKDIQAFSLPQNKKIVLPRNLQILQWARTKGHFVGLYNNFFADAIVFSNIGDGSCEIMLNSQKKNLFYDGKINLRHFALGQLLGVEKLGNISLSSQIKGKGTNLATMDTHINGNVSELELNGTNINNITLNGRILSKQFNGEIVCQDSNLQMDFDGLVDFNAAEPKYDFSAQLEHINLSQLKLFRPDSNACLKADITMNMVGKTLDSLQGSLNVKNITYSENNIYHYISDIALNIDMEEDKKQVVLQSDMANAEIEGHFEYVHLLTAWKWLLHKQLPALVASPDTTGKYQKHDQNFECLLNIKNISPILAIFAPDISLDNGMRANISLNERTEKMNLSMTINQIKIKDQAFNGIKVFSSHQYGNPLFFNVNCASYQSRSTDTMVDLSDCLIKTAVFNDSIQYFIVGKGNENNKIEDIFLQGVVGFRSSNDLFVYIDNGSILWNNEALLLDTFNYIHISPNGLDVKNFSIHSVNDNKSLHVKTIVSERNEKVLSFDFNEIELGMTNIFLNRFGISVQGKATGTGGLINLYSDKDFAIGSNFHVDDFEFNDVALGYLDAKTVWVNELKKLFISSDLYIDTNLTGNKLMSLHGYFNPREKYIDLDGNIENFNIKVLEPFLTSFANKVEGIGTGYVTFSGPISNAKLLGEVSLSGVLGIDFLKTEYFFDKATIAFVDTGFTFKDMQVTDMYKNNAVVNGVITHEHLKNWGVDMHIKASKTLALNTTVKDNKLFYGKGFVSGNVHLKTDPQGMQINADITTEPKTDISLLFDWAKTASENNFISFVSTKTNNQILQSIKKEQDSKMAINMKIKITPTAVVRVFLDPSIGGTITGRGNGNIELNLDRNNNFTLYGSHTLTGGTFDLAYGDILTRSFKIQNGGTLSWAGNPLQGKINVQAIQSTKVSINNLVNNSESAKYRPISVNNILNLNGNLLSPTFNFSFELPDADESVKNIVYNFIDTTDREEMVRQLITVLFWGSFDVSSQGSVSSGGLGYSISELISHQINKVVSSLSENIDVRLAYRNNEDMAEQEYSMDIGGSFLNDRLTIRTTLGVLNQQDIADNDRFLGDIIVEYKIIPDGSLKAKAFNVTNQQEKLEYTSKYSQGLGLSFSKSFDTYKELFTRKRKKNKKIITDSNQDTLSVPK
ncbi:MAG: translocation/assembly module TamB domain-containing protein [Bacteroidales bacterium]|nr:translocation/assembly module TamB domain-containing protein [Bacteroidales bacterium]